MSVISDENKSLLWQILKNHPLAEDSHYFDQLITEETQKIHRVRFKYHSDLTLMNKEIIKYFSVLGKATSGSGGGAAKPPAPPVSKNFESRLKEQQDNFLKLANPSKPTDIDFTDKLEECAIPTMNTTLQQRERELLAIMEEYKEESAAKKWIESDHKGDKIKIDQKSVISLKAKSPTAKRVTFQIDEDDNNNNNNNNNNNTTTSFFSKLKKKEERDILVTDSPSNEKMDLLREILVLQSEMNKRLIALEEDVQKITISLQKQSFL